MTERFLSINIGENNKYIFFKNLFKNMNFFNKIFVFMKEVYVEMKKVNWPTTKETIRYTLIVLAVSIAVAAFLGGADVLFSAILSKFIIK